MISHWRSSLCCQVIGRLLVWRSSPKSQVCETQWNARASASFSIQIHLWHTWETTCRHSRWTKLCTRDWQVGNFHTQWCWLAVHKADFYRPTNTKGVYKKPHSDVQDLKIPETRIFDINMYHLCIHFTFTIP